METMVNQVVDIEWQFGVTAASSEMDQVGASYLFLKLVINTGGEEGLKNVYMEMTLPQFYAFLHELETAKSTLCFVN